MNRRATLAIDNTRLNGHLAHLENTHIILNEKKIKGVQSAASQRN